MTRKWMLRSLFRPHSARRARSSWSRRLERLEGREVPAVFTVTNLNDGPVSGPGQLPGSPR